MHYRRPFAWMIAMMMLLLGPALAPRLAAEESFRATHVALFHPPGVRAERSNRLGIFRFDRERTVLDFRMTIIALPDRVTGMRLVRRAGDGSADRVFRSVALPGEHVTFTGFFSGLSADEIGAIDSGLAYIIITSVQNTSSFVEARIDPIPNGFARTVSPATTIPPAEGSKGFGSALIVLNENERSVRYYLHWEDLMGPAISVQFQRGTVVDPGVLLETALLPASTDGDAVGTWSDLADEEMLALRSGGIYVNVTSEVFPGGEIRGQVSPIEVFTAALDPSNEAPPVAGTSASGTGFLFITVEGNNGTQGNAMFAAGRPQQAFTEARIQYGGIGQTGSVFTGMVNGGLGSFFIPQQVMEDRTDLAILRSAGMYVNILGTGYPDGEIRGQLIPAALHIEPVSSAPVAVPVGGGASIRYDAAADAIIYSIGDELAAPTIVVSDVAGRALVTERANGHRGMIPAHMLTSGIYMVRIVADGAIRTARPVMVAR